MTEAEWREAADNYQGFCLSCRDWTRECTEPDVDEHDNYHCPVCHGTVIGADTVLYTDSIDWED